MTKHFFKDFKTIVKGGTILNISGVSKYYQLFHKIFCPERKH